MKGSQLGDSPRRSLADSGARVPKCYQVERRNQRKVFYIAGGLSVTALPENDHERVTVYTKHRLTLQALVTEALGS